MKKIAVSLLCVLCNLNLHGQSWVQLPIQLNDYAKCLYTDTIDNLLYIGGMFGLNGTDSVRGVATWNNNSISGCGEGINNFYHSSYCADPISDIMRFQNKIYVGAGGSNTFTVGDSIWTRGIGVWDGIAWDSIHVGLLDKYGQASGVTEMKVINGELYVGGSFISINGTTEAHGLAKFDGTNWSTVYDFPQWSIDVNVVRHIAEYNGEIYVAGQLVDNYPYDTMYNICRFNGSKWEQLGNGIGGAFSDIRGMEVYQGKLYVYGAFSKNDNPLNPGNRIAAWNGTNWEQVVDIQGTYAYVKDMAVLNGELYVVGMFSGVNGYPASNFAKFDGVNWCTYPDVFAFFIEQVETYDGEVYISGVLNETPDTPLQAYAKFDPNAVPLQCEPYLARVDEVGISGFDVYPNPTSGIFELKNAMGVTEISIMDVSGKVVKEFKNLPQNLSNNVDLDVGDLKSGVYFVSIKNSNKYATAKLVKL